jgi:hypothetical protein
VAGESVKIDKAFWWLLGVVGGLLTTGIVAVTTILWGLSGNQLVLADRIEAANKRSEWTQHQMQDFNNRLRYLERVPPIQPAGKNSPE